MIGFANMAAVGLIRSRLFLLVLAFGLGLGGQVAARIAMATPLASTVAIASAAGQHPGCGGAAAPAPRCPIAFCSIAPAIILPASSLEPPAAAIPLFPFEAAGHGVASRPDPHPPKFLPV